MDRRSFLRTMVGGVAVGAAVRTWPFRVFSFPSAVEVVNPFSRNFFPPLLAPGLRHVFLNYAALRKIGKEDEVLPYSDPVWQGYMLG